MLESGEVSKKLLELLHPEYKDTVSFETSAVVFEVSVMQERNLNIFYIRFLSKMLNSNKQRETCMYQHRSPEMGQSFSRNVGTYLQSYTASPCRLP
jgi:hypothetical protein